MSKSAIDLKTTVSVLVVLFILSVLNDHGYLQGPKDTALALLSPVTSRFQASSAAASDFVRTVREIGELKDRNVELETRNAALGYELSGLKETARENAELRKQLSFKENACANGNCLTFVPGSITSRGLDAYGKYILIDRGQADGARVGQAVTAGGGILLGKISEVNEHYAKMVLLTSPDSSVNCITQTTRANGLLRGKYGTGARLEMIDQNEALAEGDLLITSGLEAGIPKGLILGKVAAIEQSPNSVFKSADAALAADFNHIETVFLVK